MSLLKLWVNISLAIQPFFADDYDDDHESNENSSGCRSVGGNSLQ